MKQQPNDQKKEKNQIRGRNDESITGANETSIYLKPVTTKSNMILVQNIGKDPPGRWYCPGAAYRWYPDK